MKEQKLEIKISEKESYTLYNDGVFYSHQSDKHGGATDVPQYLFEIVEFVLENYDRLKDNFILVEKKNIIAGVDFSQDLLNLKKLNLSKPNQPKL